MPVLSKYLIGVSHTFSNGKARRADNPRGRKRAVAHYLSESGNHFKETIREIDFYFKKYLVRKWKRRKAYCFECKNVFVALVKNDKDQVECPNCL